MTYDKSSNIIIIISREVWWVLGKTRTGRLLGHRTCLGCSRWCFWENAKIVVIPPKLRYVGGLQTPFTQLFGANSG